MRVGDGVLPGLLQIFQLLLVPADALVALLDVGGVGCLHFRQRNFFGGVVRGANLVRALERHVLEHVGQAGLAHGVLHRAGVHVGVEGKDRGFRTLADDDGQAVVQLLDRDSLLEGSQILRGGERGKH